MHNRRIAIVVPAILIVCLLLQGCVVFLSTTAMIMRMDGRNYFTSTVLIQKESSAVHMATVQVIKDIPEIRILEKNDKEYRIEVTVFDTEEATIQATQYSSRLTQLILTANAGEGDEVVKSKLMYMVGKICDELGVTYKLDNDKE
jgi:hypothetical protein